MAKAKNISVADAIAFMKAEGVATVSVAEDASEGGFITTGLFALDYALSGRWIDGGLPRGKISEIYGKSQGAKSTMMYSALAGTQRMGGLANIIDVEKGRNEYFMRKLSVDTNTCQVMSLDRYTVESVFKAIAETSAKIRKSGFDGPVSIGLDSIAALSTDQDVKLLMGKKVENLKEDQGRRAKLIGHYERTISEVLHKHDITLIIINQLREKVGVMYGPKETTTSGRATEYYSDCRIDMRPRKTITKDCFGAASDDDDDKPKGAKIGRYFDFSCEKSRQTAPYRYVANAELYFNHGIAPLSGVMDMLLSDEIVLHTGAGWYVLTDPETRLTHRLCAAEGAKKFTRAEVEERDWIFENAAVFGTTAERILEYIQPNISAHEYSRALRTDARASKRKSIILEGNAVPKADDDDDTEAPLAVKRAKKKADSIPLDETE